VIDLEEHFGEEGQQSLVEKEFCAPQGFTKAVFGRVRLVVKCEGFQEPFVEVFDKGLKFRVFFLEGGAHLTKGESTLSQRQEPVKKL